MRQKKNVAHIQPSLGQSVDKNLNYMMEIKTKKLANSRQKQEPQQKSAFQNHFSAKPVSRRIQDNLNEIFEKYDSQMQTKHDSRTIEEEFKEVFRRYQ